MACSNWCNTTSNYSSRWNYVFLICGMLTILCGLLTIGLIFFGMASTAHDADYAARTLHMHKVDKLAPIPQQWISLGPMYPASWTQQAITYFIYDNTNFDLENNDEVLRTKVQEHAFGHTMYVNGMTLSILSSISPVLYLGTLVLVCTLSCVRFVFEMFFPRDILTNLYCGEVDVRNYIYYIVLSFYVLSIALKFVILGTEKTVTWGEDDYALTQHYIIPLQIPSLVYCVVIGGLYWVHLTKMGDSYWENVKKKATDSLSTASRGGMATTDAESGKGLKGLSSASDSYFRPPVQFNSVSGQFLKPNLGRMPQQVWMDTANMTMLANKTQRTPTANETSVTVCFIIVLGTIASLGMSSAFLSETVAQLVIMSVIMFAVLETARMHLVTFFWYLNSEPENEDTDFYRNMNLILAFIELVVFLLQVVLFVVWQTTIDSVTIESTANMQTLRNLLFFVTIGFLLLRLMEVAYALLELAASTLSEKLKPTKAKDMFFWPETIVYVLCVLAVIFTLFAISVTPKDTTGERRLLFYEQQMYMQTKDVTQVVNHRARRAQAAAHKRAGCFKRWSSMAAVRVKGRCHE